MTSAVWCWSFNSPAELRHALEEYTAFQEGTLVHRYGVDAAADPDGPAGEINLEELARVAARYGLRLSTDESGAQRYADDGQPLIEDDPDAAPREADSGAQAEMCAAQQRSEIDACMKLLRRVYPHMARLIDGYYREGQSLTPHGWIEAASDFGIHKVTCPPLTRCPVSPGDNRPDLPDCQRGEKRHCQSARMMFEALMWCAVGRLYDVHKVRSGRAS